MNNNLLELIQGADVEWKPLEEVAEIKTGQSVSKQKIIDNPGEYPVINSGREPLGYIAEFNTENDPIGITSRGAGVGSVTYQEGKYFRGNLNYSVSVKSGEELNFKYLYHTLLFLQDEIHNLCTFSGIPALNASELKKLQIPIPSLEIQQKVVEILDKMTDYVTELTAELTLRQKQYAYYRDQLLSFGVEENSLSVEWMTLGEVARLKNGSDWKNLTGGSVPVYGSGGEMGVTVGKAAYDKPTVLIPRKGSISNLFYLTTPFWNVDTIYYTKIDEEKIVPKFFYYYLKMINLEALSINPTRPSLTQAILDKVKIPVPNLIEQRRIVEILDKFDKLMSDLSEGLPREIELRQKQYEYWREQLLNFN